MKGHQEDCHCGSCAVETDAPVLVQDPLSRGAEPGHDMGPGPGYHDPDEEQAPPSKVFRLVDFHHEDGHRVAVVGEPGRKWIYAATFDAPIRLLKLPLDEQKHMRDLTDTTPAKAAKKMLAAGKRLGITDGAKAFLRSVG
jgi:hypothetical protein